MALFHRKSYIINMILAVLLFILSIVYFHKNLSRNKIVILGDLRYALNVSTHILHHLKLIYVHAPKLPVLSLLYILKYILGDILALNFMMPLILFISTLFVYYSNLYFIKKIIKNNKYYNNLAVYIAAFIGSLVFMYNPWTINKMQHHYWLVLSLASSYLLIAEVDKILFYSTKKINIFNILLVALLFDLSATQPQAPIIYTATMLFIYIILFSIINSKKFIKRIFNFRILGIILLVIALNSFWIVPQAFTLLSGVSKPASYGIVVENVDMLSRRASLLNAFRATNGWIWGGYGPLSTANYSIILKGIDVWEFVSLLPAVLVGISIIVGLRYASEKETRGYILYFASIYVFSIAFSTGTYYPIIGCIYRYVFLNLPFGWVFRDPFKNTGLTIIAMSGFVSILSYFLLSEREHRKSKDIGKNLGGGKWLRAIGLAFILASVLVWGWPGLTGDFNGHLKPLPYPSDLKYIINYLANHTSYKYNILWYPLSKDKGCLVYEDVPELSTSDMNVFEINSYNVANYLDYLIRNNETSQILNFLKKIGVRYIITRHDFINIKNRYVYRLFNNVKILDNLLKQFMIYKKDNFTLYDIKSSMQIIRICSYPVFTTSPYLSKDFMFNCTISSLIPLNDIYFISQYSKDILYISSLIKKYIIKLRSIHYDPSRYWSQGSFRGGWLNDINVYLNKFGITTWGSDYGYGLVFTWANKYVPKDIQLKLNYLVVMWKFVNESIVRLWKRYTPERQFGALQEIVWDRKDMALEAVLYNSTWGWKIIKSPLVPAKYNDVYRIVLRIRGINVEGLHVKIAEFTSDKKLIDIKYIKFIGSGTFGWKIVSYNYAPSRNDVRFFQIQLWHGHLTSKPLPNIVLINYVKIYNITKYVKPVTLTEYFKIVKENNYKIFIRYLENQRGGAIRVYLDGKLIARINTTSQLNKFVWRDLGTYRLKTGEHTLTLENVKGFNAVNLFLVIPKDKYEELIKEIRRFLTNGTIIYIFEAESDMFRENAKVVWDVNASNGEALLLEQGGSAWQEFNVIKGGYYMIAVKLHGTAKISIDSKSFDVVSKDMSRFIYMGPIYLSKGKHVIHVETLRKPLYLDVAWIYSISTLGSRSTIDNISINARNESANVISYKRINLALWRVKVVAKRPFMLVFAETYDPFWTAVVYKYGKLVEKVRPVPVYGIINGFWINEIGNLTIVIRYIPYDWFGLGLRISAAAFALCVFYIIWDRGMVLGNKRALRLWRWIGKVLRRL